MGVLLGEKVRYAREKKGLTARELAEKAKITQPYISEIENGKRTPSAKTIMGLAHALDVPGEFLLRNDVKTIKGRNSQFRIENDKLRARIKELENKIEALI